MQEGRKRRGRERSDILLRTALFFTVHAKISAHIEMQLQITKTLKSPLYFPAYG